MNIGICMLIQRFYPFVGGTEIQALRLAQVLYQQKVKVFVVTSRLGKIKSFEKIEDLPVYRLFTLNSGWVGSIVFMFASFWFLIKHRKDYQIIHVHLASSPAITAVVAGRLLGKKVIVKLGGARQTGDVGTSLKTFWGRWKLRFLKKYVDIFIYPTKEIKQELLNIDFSQEKCRYIPNGVDIGEFKISDIDQQRKLRQKLGLLQAKIAIFVGRLEIGKGLEWLLEVWAKLVTQISEAYLIILGEGTLKNNLERLAKTLQIDKSVKFLGKVEKVISYLQASDLFIFPSQGEGLSNALLEAMACGLPPVVTRIGGTDEIINEGLNGFLVNFRDDKTIIEKILFLFGHSDKAKKIGERARNTVENNYAIEKIGQQYILLYKQLVSEGGRSGTT